MKNYSLLTVSTVLILMMTITSLNSSAQGTEQTQLRIPQTNKKSIPQQQPNAEVVTLAATPAGLVYVNQTNPPRKLDRNTSIPAFREQRTLPAVAPRSEQKPISNTK
jgi:hypothetical protein